jgi:superoxide dismutase, Fe-Mn family
MENTNQDLYRLDFEHVRKDVGYQHATAVAACLEGGECLIHVLPSLGFSYDALEPYIDARTMEDHHCKHHRSYVEKLNLALQDSPDLMQKSLEDLLRNLSDIPPNIQEAVRNNGGGHFNHSMLWTILSPKKETKPSKSLVTAVKHSFSSFENLQGEVKHLAKNFGKGNVWAYADGKSGISLKALPNQDCPLMEGLTPIFLIDLWEHAYYLKYQNNRNAYIDAFWQVINWEEVSRRWEAA